jgi:hypothetical protein
MFTSPCNGTPPFINKLSMKLIGEPRSGRLAYSLRRAIMILGREL